MPLFEASEIVHAKHYKDGYPLCWDMDQDGMFQGSWDDTEVTCQACKDELAE